MADQIGVFFDRLMSRVDPHHSAVPALDQQAQVLAGRWLALQRIRAGLNAVQVAKRLGLPAETLLLLETGLADEALAQDAVWVRLAAMLAEPKGAAGCESVLNIALGRFGAADTESIVLIEADLRRMTANNHQLSETV